MSEIENVEIKLNESFVLQGALDKNRDSSGQLWGLSNNLGIYRVDGYKSSCPTKNRVLPLVAVMEKIQQLEAKIESAMKMLEFAPHVKAGNLDCAGTYDYMCFMKENGVSNIVIDGYFQDLEDRLKDNEPGSGDD